MEVSVYYIIKYIAQSKYYAFEFSLSCASSVTLVLGYYIFCDLSFDIWDIAC